jgi:hypothetical protein
LPKDHVAHGISQLQIPRQIFKIVESIHCTRIIQLVLIYFDSTQNASYSEPQIIWNTTTLTHLAIFNAANEQIANCHMFQEIRFAT